MRERRKSEVSFGQEGTKWGGTDEKEWMARCVDEKAKER